MKFYNFRALILGQSGYGKSLYAKKFIIDHYKDFDHIIVVDLNGEYQFLRFFPNVTLLDLNNAFDFILRFYKERENKFKETGKILKEKTLFVFDEVDSYILHNDNKMIKLVYAIANYGRKYGFNMLAVARRPRRLPISVLALATRLIIFKMFFKSDINHLGLQEFTKELQQLKHFEYYQIDL